MIQKQKLNFLEIDGLLTKPFLFFLYSDSCCTYSEMIGCLVISCVATLLSTINCNIQLVNQVVFNTLVKKEHLLQIFRPHTTSNEMLPIIPVLKMNSSL